MQQQTVLNEQFSCNVHYRMMVFNTVLPEVSKVICIHWWFLAVPLTCGDFFQLSKSWWNLHTVWPHGGKVTPCVWLKIVLYIFLVVSQAKAFGILFTPNKDPATQIIKHVYQTCCSIFSGCVFQRFRFKELQSWSKNRKTYFLRSNFVTVSIFFVQQIIFWRLKICGSFQVDSTNVVARPSQRSNPSQKDLWLLKFTSANLLAEIPTFS